MVCARHANVADVVFCDLVGSTALSVRFDPEELREEIRAYQNAVSGVVARYGFVAKFMGDGVLAYFGYPRAHDDGAERAVRAGLEIAAAVSSLETRGTERLAVRIGIATGLQIILDTLNGLKMMYPEVSTEPLNAGRSYSQSAIWTEFGVADVALFHRRRRAHARPAVLRHLGSSG
jgi:hypothetical protein